MLFEPRIGLKPLAQLCRRLAIATGAGIDERNIWRREAEHARPALRVRLNEIRDAVAEGESVTDAFRRTGNYFPLLFREMVAVGEETGTREEVLRRLADYFEHLLKLRRTLLSGLAWPMTQLTASVAIVGMLIWIMGVLPARGGEPVDMLGWGLAGTSGLVIYLFNVGLIVAVVALLVRAIQRGLLWTRPLQYALLQLPMVGSCLKTLAMARLTWTLNLALNVAMDLRRVLPLALRSTGNDYFVRHADQVVADIVGGQEIHESLRNTGAFDEEFLQSVAVGEQSGRLVETMRHLSLEYEDRTRAAMRTLTTILGFALWAVVALIIISIIISIFMRLYVGAINDAANF